MPTTSTLIYGNKDAVLVDTQLTAEASKDLLEWVVATGKNVTHIYITHAHGDHFFGNSTILSHFPDAKVLTTAEIAAKMKLEVSPQRVDSFWDKLFPGQLPQPLTAKAEVVRGDEFSLEGEKLVVVRTGHTDTDETTSLWVPSIRLAVTGDAVYNNVHPYLGEGATPESRDEWIRALDKIAALQPLVVVGGHSNPDKGFRVDAIHETKAYLQTFNKLSSEASTAEDLYGKMVEHYPEWLNPGSAWAGATAVKK
jgi:glyoxylase-like metal-dependent hydrolase (beta-lactamase superfamily II)